MELWRNIPIPILQRLKLEGHPRRIERQHTHQEQFCPDYKAVEDREVSWVFRRDGLNLLIAETLDRICECR
jgi:hypothetical protein